MIVSRFISWMFCTRESCKAGSQGQQSDAAHGFGLRKHTESCFTIQRWENWVSKPIRQSEWRSKAPAAIEAAKPLAILWPSSELNWSALMDAICDGRRNKLGTMGKATFLMHHVIVCSWGTHRHWLRRCILPHPWSGLESFHIATQTSTRLLVLWHLNVRPKNNQSSVLLACPKLHLARQIKVAANFTVSYSTEQNPE